MMTLLKSLLAVTLVALAAEGHAQQVVGRVLVAAGQVTVVRQGNPSPARAGTALQVGDSVVTAAAANAQLGFIDDSLVALRESSSFLIEKFQFQQAAGQNGLAFSLLRGGLRTVTGLIGATRRDDYRVTTPIASVGIRGTHYSLLYCQDDCVEDAGVLAPNGAYGGVYDGAVAVSNNAGEAEFGRDEYFFVADINTLPQPLLAPPSFLADRLKGLAKGAPKAANEPTPRAADATSAAAGAVDPPGAETPVTGFVATETRAAGGAPLVVGSTAPQSALTFVHSLVETNGGNSTYGGATLGTAIPGLTFVSSPNGELASINLEVGDASRIYTRGPGGSDMLGSDPVSGARWGRWVDPRVAILVTDDSLAIGTQVPPGGVHYMYGVAPTSDAVLAARTGSVSFSDVGGTTPTNSAGQVATSFAFGPMNVNFTTRSANLSAINVTFPNASWSYSNVPFTFQTGPGNFTHLDGTLNGIGTCTGPGCGGATVGSLFDSSATFVGTSGNFLALGFQGNAGDGASRVSWAAARLFRCATCP
ncbi:MAG: FecR domain-containing protein [Candidatus Eisenbacteria bacterium]